MPALLALAACSGPEAPWRDPPPVAIDLKIDVSAERVALLQPVVVRLDVFRRGDLEVEFAPEVDAADFLAETAELPEVELGDGFWRRTTLTLRPVRGPGELELPAFVARAVDGTAQARTEPRRIVVESALAGHGSELEAPAAPFPRPPRTLLWVGSAVAALALIGGLLWLLLRRKDARPTAAAIAQPPHVKALRALERLRTAPRRTEAEVGRFYVEVSDVLRRYLEERFGLHAPERTTEEFLRELESGDALAREHRGELQEFLSQCDLVKFARHRPNESDHLATFALAEAFIERTRPDRTHQWQPASLQGATA